MFLDLGLGPASLLSLRGCCTHEDDIGARFAA